ncbi:restriction endonuclease subunit S [uncultured Cyclobacterium sp.]|uniref:restriction endonuclease subunit S n=1 Tax=uncultured Cyclobacterium sp. TaxID=453820 RepID=UPI0030ED50C4|tara:strand:- start:17231 stop:18508 length:1278 start_codon:yes stop_codon:yes gene_type:complete
MTDFRLVKLGEVAKFRNGLNFQKSSNGQKIKIVGVSDFKNRLTPNYEELEEIQVDGKLHIEDYLNYGDIVFVRSNGNKALVARSLFIDKNENLSFSGFCIKARIIDEKILLRKYFLYFTKTSQFKYAVSKGAIGTNINNLNQGILYDVKVLTPSINTQQLIVKLLSDLDSKIELNNKINAELEGMAKLIYKYWFVQFDFPFDFAQGKLADESSDPKDVKPYKSSGGKMVWNKELKREIPEGWEVKELKDIASITMGQSPPGESYNENSEGTVFFQGCTDFGNRFPTIRKFTTMPTRFANEGDLLLSIRAPVGAINIAKEHCCIGRGLAALGAKNGQKTFLFGVMQNLKQIFDRRNVDGTTFGAITKDDLFSIKVVRPEKSIIDHFHKLTITSFKKQNKCEFENIQLSTLRDWLLPMLMNGQVKIN